MEEEKTPEATQALYGLKLNRGAFGEAKSLLGQMPTTTAEEKLFVRIQTINMERLEKGGEFVLTEEMKLLLETAAFDASPVRVYAQGILTLLTGQRFKREEEVQENNSPLPLPEMTTESQFRITPNPAKDQIRLEFTEETPLHSTVRIIDQLGRVVQEQDISSVMSTTLGVDQLSDGIYFVSVHLSNGTILQQKVVISH